MQCCTNTSDENVIGKTNHFLNHLNKDYKGAEVT